MELYATFEEYLKSKQDFYIDEENVADQKVRAEIHGFDVIGSSRAGAYQVYQDEKLFGIFVSYAWQEEDQLTEIEEELRVLTRDLPMDSYYYTEHKLKATNATATQEDINRLGTWFELYGSDSWNGECYDVEGRSLYPIHQEYDGPADQDDVIGYEFR